MTFSIFTEQYGLYPHDHEKHNRAAQAAEIAAPGREQAVRNQFV